ncbi:MAG: type VI secretion system accessory protein TagJ [Acidobacteriota bacterium]
MVTARQLLDAGQLKAAIEAVTGEVRAAPGDISKRVFLFELLCFAGEWERAEKQLDVIGAQDVKAEIGVKIYRDNIAAERQRHQVFNHGALPNFFVEPTAYVSWHLKAVSHIRAGEYTAAREWLERAEEERPAFPGKFNGQPFGDFRDADDLVAPILELIVQDRYLWLPFSQIKRLEIVRPAKLRDLIWAPVKIEAAESLGGFTGQAFIPALYAGTSQHENDQVRLGRMTDWRAYDGELAASAGLRLFLVDGEDKTIFEANTIEFGSSPANQQ